MMRRLLREPLLHFALLGALLFAAYGVLNGGAPRAGEIVVTSGQIESLSSAFARSWQRPPTAEELDGLIRTYVREEVLSREAIALGLDRDDTVIRRRLRQKMEFISDDLSADVEPTDGDLRTYLEQHKDSFHADQRFSFRQVYLNPDRRGDAVRQDAERLLRELNRLGDHADAVSYGDRLLLDPEFTDLSRREAAGLFGEAFASRLAELPLGQWAGPVESGYGVHVVLVEGRTEGRVPPLEEIRDDVRREWEHARRLAANEQFYQALRQRYTVTIERSVENQEVAESQGRRVAESQGGLEGGQR